MPGKALAVARTSEDSSRMVGATIASLTVHGGVAAALFLGLADSRPAAPPPAAMVVEMASLPSAPPVPPTEAPPQPEQEKADPKPIVDKLKLPPIPKLAFAVKPEVVVPVKPEPENKKQAEKPAEETTKAAAPYAEIKDKPKAPNFGAPSNTPSSAEQSWEARVLAALERKKRYPAAAQSAGQQDVVYVTISMDRSGRVVNSKIKRSRGFSLLDSEVMSIVRRASPLPKPPQIVGGDPVIITVPVNFFIKK
jgi:protein TonB